jgi:hypothetical protein
MNRRAMLFQQSDYCLFSIILLLSSEKSKRIKKVLISLNIWCFFSIRPSWCFFQNIVTLLLKVCFLMLVLECLLNFICAISSYVSKGRKNATSRSSMKTRKCFSFSHLSYIIFLYFAFMTYSFYGLDEPMWRTLNLLH